MRNRIVYYETTQTAGLLWILPVLLSIGMMLVLSACCVESEKLRRILGGCGIAFMLMPFGYLLISIVRKYLQHSYSRKK